MLLNHPFLTSCSVLAALLLAPPLRAQAPCGTDEAHAALLASDTSYQAAMEALRNARNLPTGARDEDAPYIVPVVVHVIHLGEAEGYGSNMSDAQVLSAIRGLNERFSGELGSGADTGFRFVLAQRTPQGCPTNGILRVDGRSVPGYAEGGINFSTDHCGANETALKNLSRWPVLQYYNIWVVHRICGGWGGYAYYPWGGSIDGTVMRRQSMTYSDKSLAHELGHGFNLPHTFQGDDGNTTCPANDDCATDGDQICDTPPHRQSDCGDTNPCYPEGVWNNSRYNVMSYCWPSNHLLRFTPDQTTRMHAAAAVYPRSNLFSSLGWLPADTLRTTEERTICSGDSYAGYSVAGTYVDSLTSSTGCDSVRTLVLTIAPLPSAPMISVQAEGLLSSYSNGNQWYLDDVPEPGATEQLLPDPRGGSWTVRHSDTNGCIAFSEAHYVSGMGIGVGAKAPSYTLHPGNGPGTLVIGGLANPTAHVRLFNALGQQLAYHHALQERLIFQDLVPGLYIVTVHSGSQRSVLRTVVD